MFSIFRKNKAEAQEEAREGHTPHDVEPRVAKVEQAPRLKIKSPSMYDLGSQNKLNRKLGGRMFDDYSG